MSERKIMWCQKCLKNKASHSVGNRELCCECYVKEGNPPADWHPKCMETYKKMKK